MFEEHISDKNRYIITFKKKEMRKDKEMDKTAILQRSVGPRLEFIDGRGQYIVPHFMWQRKGQYIGTLF